MNARENQKKNTDPKENLPLGVSDGNASGCVDVQEAGDAALPSATTPPLRLPLLLCIACVIVLFDQVTKWIVTSNMYLYDSLVLIPGTFAITRLHNTGIAFGLFPGLPDVFMVVTLISMCVVFYFYVSMENRNSWLTFGCGLILGGAMGNLLDRFRLKYVVDFIDFSFWPAFNVADSAVSVGVTLLLISYIREEKGMRKNASDTV